MSKKTPKLIVTMSVEYNDGPKVESYEALAMHLAEEWEGLEVYFQDPDQDDETSVNLYVSSIDTIES